MAIIECPACFVQYQVSDTKISEKSKLRCQKCGTVFLLQDGLKSDDVTLDFGASTDSSSQEGTLLVGRESADYNNETDDEEIHDHIQAPLQNSQETETVIVPRQEEFAGEDEQAHDVSGVAATGSSNVEQETLPVGEEEDEEDLSVGPRVDFSDDQIENEGAPLSQRSEDFSDLEQALEALADGSFHQEMERREARKSFVRAVKIFGTGVVILAGLIGGISWYVLPSRHEKLVSRYDKLVVQSEIDPKSLVELFFDTTIAQDKEVFTQLAAMVEMPKITQGKVLETIAEYEEISLGRLGAIKSSLKKDIVLLEAQIEEKDRLLKEWSEKQYSIPSLEEQIRSLDRKIQGLVQESMGDIKKLETLRQKLELLLQDIKQFEKQRDENFGSINSTDKTEYEAATKKLEELSLEKKKLEGEIQKGETAHKKWKETYGVKIAAEIKVLKEQRADLERQLAEARLLKDTERSPLVVLPKEINYLTQLKQEEQQELEHTTDQLDLALQVFSADGDVHRDQLVEADFSYAKKNVAVAMTMQRGDERRGVIDVRRYYAKIPAGRVFQSRWMVTEIKE